jgi:hypothetical protein
MWKPQAVLFAIALALPNAAFAVQITVSGGTSEPAANATSVNPGIAIGSGVPNTGGLAPAAPATTAVPPSGAASVRTAADMAAAAISTTNAELVAIGGLSVTSQVHVILVNANDSDLAALTKAMTDMAADVAKLQAAIDADVAFKNDLQTKSVAVNKIVAGEVTTDGSLTLYAMM